MSLSGSGMRERLDFATNARVIFLNGRSVPSSPVVWESWRGIGASSLYAGGISPVKLSAPGLSLAEKILITDLVSLLVTRLFRLSIFSRVSFGRLCV